MKLSEAIRLGAMMRPQARGTYFICGKSCAIAAALEALGLNDGADTYNALALYAAHRQLATMYPVIQRVKVDPPIEVDLEGRASNVNNIIIALNNHSGWTREAIADWVETIERAQETPTLFPSKLFYPREVEANAAEVKRESN